MWYAVVCYVTTQVWRSYLQAFKNGNIMKTYLWTLALTVSLYACNNHSGTTNTGGDSATNGHSGMNHGTAEHGASGNNYMKTMHDAMNHMMTQMQTMKPTGDADYDFAMMMKHHHEGAVEMARAEVAGGTNAQMKQMAQQMIVDQQREIAAFDQFMQGRQPKGNSNFGKQSMGMMTPMSSEKMDGKSLDAMFATMMIPHHEDGIKMSTAYLPEAKDANLKKIAQDIINTQRKEVDLLQQWLKQQ
jgi:uncharacterized protein (DUF305 family)